MSSKCPTPWKRRLRPISAYNVRTIRASEKCWSIANKKSTTRFPASYSWSTYVTPNSPEGWIKTNLSFLWIKINLNRIVCYIVVSFCENVQRQSCSRTIPLSNGVKMLAVNVTLQPFSPKVSYPFNKGGFRRISASVVRTSEKMCNYKL